jgi:hypothetical protein
MPATLSRAVSMPKESRSAAGFTTTRAIILARFEKLLVLLALSVRSMTTMGLAYGQKCNRCNFFDLLERTRLNGEESRKVELRLSSTV